MKAQLNVRMAPKLKQEFREFCVVSHVEMQNALLACVEFLLSSEKITEEILTRARELRAEAIEP